MNAFLQQHRDAASNVQGTTRYIDDLPEPKDCLHAALVLSTSAHGRISSIDDQAARTLDPSVRILRAADVPGVNQIGVSKADEPLLPENEWEYWGQPLLLVLASSRSLARKAAALVTVQGGPLPAVFDPREAAARKEFILPSRTIRKGEPEKAFARCAYVVTGRVDSAGQEHLYLETQGAYAELRDGGKVFIIASTQGPTVVQKAAAQALGLCMSMVEVEARRLGGGFGGKEDQAAYWGALAALGAFVTGKPVKLYLDRKTDMRATGKRHPYSSDFRIGADASGTLLAFEADYYQSSGVSCDLSPAILSRTLFHATGAYKVPQVRVSGYMCRTNLPSFTAFRGFGAPQGFFVIESAMDALAQVMGIDPVALRFRNLYREGDETHFGMPLVRCRAEEAFARLRDKTDLAAQRRTIAAFNSAHRRHKRGMAVIPVCFGISFTKLPMNLAGALVHVYQDGSVLVSTGAVEMGQQVARKIAIIAAAALGVNADIIKVERTSTLTVANTVPTAASTGADLNGMAAYTACGEIKARLVAKAAQLLGETMPDMGTGPIDSHDIDIRDGLIFARGKATSLTWKALIAAAQDARIDLSAHGFYATPGLFYDMQKERGTPFAYHVYGAALVTATVDTLRGDYTIDAVDIVHDIGRSIDTAVDIGQIEGALAQGLGWSLIEELKFGDEGRLVSDTLSTYKVPDASFMPQDISIELLPEGINPSTPFNSKAVGEPPLIYGIAGYFAVLDALRAACGAAGQRPQALYDLPLTPEKVSDYLAGARATPLSVQVRKELL